MARFNFIARLGAGIERWIQAVFNYGSVEGVLYIHGEPAPPGIQLACAFAKTGEEGCFWFCRKFTRTTEGGRYRFPFIPAGEAGLGRCYDNTPGRSADVERRVQVRRGETTVLDLGLGRGKISGQFLSPDADAEQMQWTELPSIWLESLRPGVDSTDYPIEEFSGAWRKGEYNADSWKDPHGRSYFVAVDSMGKFRISGIHPGEYALKIEIESEWPPSGLLCLGTIGFRLVTVGCSGEEAIDVGEVILPKQGLSLVGSSRVEGLLYVNGLLAPRGTEVACSIGVDWNDEYTDKRMETCGYLNRAILTTNTDRTGRFVFENVPVGDVIVGRPDDVHWDDSSFDDETEECRLETIHIRLERGVPASVTVGATTATVGT